jgi:hypothetical protein
MNVLKRITNFWVPRQTNILATVRLCKKSQLTRGSQFVIRLFTYFIFNSCGPDSSVGIGTGYGLGGPGIESRWRARFFAPVQTGPGPTQPPVQWVLGLSRGA